MVTATAIISGVIPTGLDSAVATNELADTSSPPRTTIKNLRIDITSIAVSNQKIRQ